MEIQCKSKNCAYYFDQCIRDAIILQNGECPHYTSSDLMMSSIFHYPAVYVWDVVQGDKTYTQKGHILEVAAMYYKDPYVFVTPNVTENPVLSRKCACKDYVSMHMYLRFIDSHITPLYLESFLYEYLSGFYTLTKIDCCKQYVYLEGVKSA
jgi:hypothetical protein